MLGLGNNITSGNKYPSGFSPTSIANLRLWLKVGKDIFSNEDTLNNAQNHSTNLGNMEDEDMIHRWEGLAGVSQNVDAFQNESEDKPRWDATPEHVGALNFKNNTKFMDLNSQVVVPQNKVFSLVIRLQPTDVSSPRAILGHSNTEFFSMQSLSSLRIKIDNNQVNFTHGSLSLPTNKYTVIILTRNADKQLNAYGKGFGGPWINEEQIGTANQYENPSDTTQAGEFTISNIGCKSDDSSNFNGYIKDVLVYNGTVLNATQRGDLYTYLYAQEY